MSEPQCAIEQKESQKAINQLEEDFSFELAQMRQEMDLMRKDMADLIESVEGLVSAWRTANGLVTFVKWFGGFCAGAVAIVAAFKTGFKG